MRQSGILAAMCLYALDNNVDRLADDHALAARIAGALKGYAGVDQVLPADTNIVIFDVAETAPTAAEIVESLEKDGIQADAFGERRIRLVTHLDVDEGAGDALCAGLSALLS